MKIISSSSRPKFGIRLKVLAAKVGVDRAVSYTILGQVQSAFILPLTLFLVGSALNPAEQGFYFTFGSVISLQVLVELGFTQSIVQLVSHEMVNLEKDGDGILCGPLEKRERIGSLFHLFMKWYAIVAVLAFALLLGAGWWLFSKQSGYSVNWKWPWTMLALVTAVQLCVDPFWSFLEGMNEVPWVAKTRIFLNLAKGGTLCATLFLGFHLFAPVLSVIAYIGIGLVLLYRKWRNAFKDLGRRGGGVARVDWRHEVLPYQWRIAVSWLAGYFIFPIMNPLLFHMLGPITAGQFGMTWTALQTGASFGGAWMRTRTPKFGIAAAKKDRDGLEKIWKSAATQCIVFTIIAECGIVAILVLLHKFGFRLGTRFASIEVTVWLALAVIANQVVAVQAYYVRAHKKEPFMVLSVANAILMIGCVPMLTRWFGLVGSSLAIFTITISLIPFGERIRRRFRAIHYARVEELPGSRKNHNWHREGVIDAE